MIVQNGHSLQSKCEVETCNMRLFHPPLRLSIFYGSRDQPGPGSFLKKREEPGNEFALASVKATVTSKL